MQQLSHLGLKLGIKLSNGPAVDWWRWLIEGMVQQMCKQPQSKNAWACKLGFPPEGGVTVQQLPMG